MASLSVWIGAQFGSLIALLLGRYVFRATFENKIKKYPKFSALDKALEKDGLKLTFLLRLSPLIPFNIFNYFMGVTKIKPLPYMVGGLGNLFKIHLFY